MSKPPPYPDFPEQDENGVDLSLLRANLRLSPLERARQARHRLPAAHSCPGEAPAVRRIAAHPDFPEQDDYGVDLSLLRAGLRLTPLERVRLAERYRIGVLRVRQHARPIRRKSA
jgi:hypothetical protein